MRRLWTPLHSRGRLYSTLRGRPGARPGLVQGGRWVEHHCAHFRRHPAGAAEQRTSDPSGCQPAAVIAYAEMWTYQRARHGDNRQDLWIWTAVVKEPDGRRWVDFEVGDRSDAYEVYQSWLPPGNHVVGKGGAVNWNEGPHSWLRSKLNRLGRWTKGYTKSVEMLVYSLALLLADWTSKPNNSLC